MPQETNTLTNKNAGFTLIELLVVISVIGLLASVILVSLNGARVKARDTRRKADLKQLNTALALYYDDNGHYPIISRWATSEATTYDAGASWVNFESMLGSYLKKLPHDPLGTGSGGPWTLGNYHYAYGSDGTGTLYDLVTALEQTSDPDRCQVRTAFYHQGEGSTPPNGSWCGSWSSQMYADH